jgi:hypothetical protein
MAERMTSDVPHWEKSGNVTWVECPACSGWLPVDPKLVAMTTVKMICPHCAAQFSRDEAARIV